MTYLTVLAHEYRSHVTCCSELACVYFTCMNNVFSPHSLYVVCHVIATCVYVYANFSEARTRSGR